MNFTVEVQPGKEVRLPTGGKYCPNDILVSAKDGLPAGSIRVDPAWTDFSYLCAGRRFSLGKNLKYSDTANGRSFSNMYSGWDTGAHTVPSLDLRKGTSFSGMFSWSSCILEIGELDLSAAQNVDGMFNYCTGLQKICFVSGSIPISISFSHSRNLEASSVDSIIGGLADRTGNMSQTLTLHASVGAALTPEQKAAITAKNWTLVY